MVEINPALNPFLIHPGEKGYRFIQYLNQLVLFSDYRKTQIILSVRIFSVSWISGY